MATDINSTTSRPGNLHFPPLPGNRRDWKRVGTDPMEYKPADGEMDLMTNYRQDYTKKVQVPVKKTRNEKLREEPAKFEGLATYKEDFKKWQAMRQERITRASAYEPPTDRFDGTTNYATDYQAFPATSLFHKPLLAAGRITEGRSENNQNPKYVAPQAVWQVPPGSLPAETSNYRRDFTVKEGGRQLICKPHAVPALTSPVAAPRMELVEENSTPSKWKSEPKILRGIARVPYKKPDGEMDLVTTSRWDYTKKQQLGRTVPIKPIVLREAMEAFDGTTNYSAQYRSWPLTERTRTIHRNDYVAPEASFNGVATYRRDFADPHKPSPRILRRPFAKAKPMLSIQPSEEFVRRSVLAAERLQQRERPVWEPQPTQPVEVAISSYRSDYQVPQQSAASNGRQSKHTATKRTPSSNENTIAIQADGEPDELKVNPATESAMEIANVTETLEAFGDTCFEPEREKEVVKKFDSLHNYGFEYNKAWADEEEKRLAGAL